jgi:hypothetical protein
VARRAPAYAALALPFAAFFYLRAQAHLHMVVPFADNPLVMPASGQRGSPPSK